MTTPLTKDEEAALRRNAKLSYLRFDPENVARLLATLDAERAESARLRALFEDAGQGAYDVLALVDHYQDLALVAEAKVARLREALHGLKMEEWLTFEGNLEAHGFASVDALEAARSAMAETGGES